MGFTYARFRVSRRENGPWKVVRVLVDTGASYTMLPRRLIESLGIRPRRKETLRLADGTRIDRDLAIAWVSYRKVAFPTQVIVGEPGDASLMGVVTLEELGLRVDPRTQRLQPVKVHLLVPAMTT